MCIGTAWVLFFSPSSSAWLVGWNYRAEVRIDNSAGGPLVDYQVFFTVNTKALVDAGKMEANGRDIRFLDSDDITPLSYWIESGMNTTQTRLWITVPNIPAASAKTIYMYYGNPGAPAASDGNATFDFFDDLEVWAGWADAWMGWRSDSGRIDMIFKKNGA